MEQRNGVRLQRLAQGVGHDGEVSASAPHGSGGL
jgi:hypothetical protein